MKHQEPRYVTDARIRLSHHVREALRHGRIAEHYAKALEAWESRQAAAKMPASVEGGDA